MLQDILSQLLEEHNVPPTDYETIEKAEWEATNSKSEDPEKTIREFLEWAGYKAVTHRTEKLEKLKCPKCDERGTVDANCSDKCLYCAGRKYIYV